MNSGSSADLCLPATYPGGVNQFRSDGSLRHLLTLEGVPTAHDRRPARHAQGFVRKLGKQRPAFSQALHGVTVANLFTEPSTRTRVSFELAAKRLGADVVNLELQLSSRVKGESMLDTVYTLEALHVDVLVIRDAEPGVLALVANNVAPHVSVLSAGEAHISHPTQGLLDALTVRQHKKRFDDLAIAIVGDIQPFARRALGLAGVPRRSACRTCASSRRRRSCRSRTNSPAARATPRSKAGLKDADVVMMLRIQKERMTHASLPDADAATSPSTA